VARETAGIQTSSHKYGAGAEDKNYSPTAKALYRKFKIKIPRNETTS
jgi:hypothetical protein